MPRWSSAYSGMNALKPASGISPRNKHEAGEHRGPVDELRRGCVRCRVRTSRVASPSSAATSASAGRHEPRQRVAVVAAHEFAERGPEREPAVHRDRPVADGFAAPVGRREVGDHRRRADEERGLAEAGDDPRSRSATRARRTSAVARGRHRDDQRAADDEHAPAHADRRAARRTGAARSRRTRTRRRRRRPRSCPVPSSSST